MNKEIRGLLKGIGGILFFYLFQIGYQYLLYGILEKGNIFINNILYIIMELCLVIFYCFINYKQLKNDYNDFNANYKKYLKVGLTYWAISLVIMVLSNMFISSITGGIATNEENNRSLLEIYPVYMALSISILAPIVEELTFRGDFKEAFKNKKIFILITSLIFAGIHVFNGHNLSYFISNPIQFLYFIPYGALSVALASMYVKTDNVYTSIVIHSMHNTMSLILMTIAGI